MFDTDLERDVLAACMRDPEFVRVAVPVLQRHDFSSRIHAWVWSVIVECWQADKRVPTAAVYRVRLERDYKDEAEQEFAVEAVIALHRREPQTPRVALEEVRRFVRVSAARRAIDGIVDGLDKGDVDLAMQAITAAGSDVRDLGVVSDREYLVEWDEERVAEYMGQGEEKVSIPTPLPALNALTGGGLRAGCVGIVVATTNVGKSAFGVDLGYHALMRTGAAVVHVTTEETRLECGARYDARFSGIGRDRLLSRKMGMEDRDRLMVALQRFAEKRRRLLVHELEPDTSVEGVRALAEYVRERHPGIPMAVIVDSADHLRPPRKMESHRLAQSAIYWYLLGLVHDADLAPIAVWSTVQAPAEYVRRELSKAAVSESQDKARVASLMLGLTDADGAVTGALDPEADRVEVHLLKNRLGRVKRRVIHVAANLGTCEFVQRLDQPIDDDGGE